MWTNKSLLDEEAHIFCFTDIDCNTGLMEGGYQTSDTESMKFETESNLSSSTQLRQRDLVVSLPDEKCAKSVSCMSQRKYCCEYLIVLCCVIMTTGAMAYAIMKHFQHISSCQTFLENEEFTKCRSVSTQNDVYSYKKGSSVKMFCLP